MPFIPLSSQEALIHTQINKKNRKGNIYLVDKYTSKKIINTLEKI